MKRIIILLNLLLVFTTLSVYSFNEDEQNKDRIIRLYYTDSSGEEGLTTFEYDHNGLMYKALWELTDGSRCSVNYYSYDEKGSLVKKYREFSDGIISTQLFIYDKKNNLIEEYFERSDSITGKVNYNYDDTGKLINADCKGLNGWFYGLINYKYDNKGKKIKAELSNEDGIIGSIAYYYDNNDNLTEEIWIFKSGFRQEFIYEYERSSNSKNNPYTSSKVFLNLNDNFKLVREYYDYSGEVSGSSVFGYDESGKLIWSVFYRSDGLKTCSDFFYDIDKKLIKSVRNYSNGLHALFNYEYDDSRRLIKRDFKRSDGIKGFEKYEYNENGKLIKATWDNFDSWLTGTITFDHNSEGNIQSARFESVNGYTAELEFKYDSLKNPTHINWKFYSGDTQSYRFEYAERGDRSIIKLR